MNLLISKTDIGQYRQISKSVADAKINPFIADAQLLDILPLLNEKFYYAIMASPEDFNDLLNPTTYMYDGHTIESPGLKIVICHFAYARYVMHGGHTDTAFGVVEKNYQDGQQVSRIDKKELYKQGQNIAMQYWGQVETYLNRHTNLYPLWRADFLVSPQRRIFKLNHITR
jgi:hypothetical protein